MSQFISDFITYFNLSYLFGPDPVTVQQALGATIVAFIGALFSIMGIRCVFEMIKIVTDWSRFR